MTAAATTVEGAVEIQVAVSVLPPERRAVWLKVSLLLLVRFRQFWEGNVNRRRTKINNNLVSHRLSRLNSNGTPRCIMEEIELTACCALQKGVRDTKGRCEG